MDRRSYLVAATATALAGCIGRDDSDDSDDPDPDDDPPDTEGVEWDDNDDYEEPVEGPSEGETFDDFGELTEWENTAGTLYRVEDDAYTGSQSALIEAEESDSQARIVKSFSPPVDLSGMSPGLAAAADRSVNVLIQLFDVDGNRIDFRQQLGANTSLVRTNFGIADIEGDPDLGAILEIQIGMWVGEEEHAQLWIDDLHFVSRPEPGRVMIHFDGGYETTYTEGLPVLSEYDYLATVFVPTDRIRAESDHDGDRLTEGQLEELHDAGWTVGSYATRGLDLVESRGSDPAEEISNAREWLEENGFEDGANYVSYPGNRYDDAVLDHVEAHHDLAFGGQYPAQGNAANPYLCTQVSHPDVEEAQAALDLTAEMGGITSLSYFELGDESREGLEETLASLRDYEADGDLEIVSPAEIEAEFLVD